MKGQRTLSKLNIQIKAPITGIVSMAELVTALVSYYYDHSKH